MSREKPPSGRRTVRCRIDGIEAEIVREYDGEGGRKTVSQKLLDRSILQTADGVDVEVARSYRRARDGRIVRKGEVYER